MAPIRHLTLTVTLPVSYCPITAQVHVYREEIGREAPVPDEALTERLQFTGQTIVLSIPYPLLDYRYSIAWPPVPAPPISARAAQLRQAAANGTLGAALATSCLNSFRGSRWADFVKCGIYIPSPDDTTSNRYLTRAGLAHGTNVPADDKNIPQLIDMQEQALLRKAWWGQLPLAAAEATDTLAKRHREGLTGGEIAAATLPLIAEGDITPWAIMRVGLSAGAPAVDAVNEDAFRQALARGRFQVLYDAAGL